jgi:hypothetical protein
MTESATEIQVVRRNRAGWHIYTCEALPGLYVASKDDKTADVSVHPTVLAPFGAKGATP